MDTIASFHRAAATYAAYAAPQAALAAALAAWVPPAARRGRALEFGAGPGLLTAHLLPWSGSYHATDAAAGMVRLGEVRCPAAAWSVRDAREPAGLGPVSSIFACGLLQWLDQPAVTLRRWRAEITPGGSLTLGVWLPGTLGELESLLPNAAPVRWRSPREWENIVTHAGFALERSDVWEHRSLHSSAHSLLRAVHTMGLAPRRAVGPGRLRTVLRRYDELFATSSGVSATWRAWLARATAV
jgi:trans-aconitate methyltransferase